MDRLYRADDMATKGCGRHGCGMLVTCRLLVTGYYWRRGLFFGSLPRLPHCPGDFSAQWGGIVCSSGVGNGTYTALVALIAEATVAGEKGWR